MRVGLLLSILVLIAAGGLYYIEMQPIDPVHTPYFNNITGKMANLSHGPVHYRLYGPEDGRLVVLLHGISSCGDLLHWLATDIAKVEGVRVLTFDLYGRGHSVIPKGVKHDPQLFIGQLDELLDKIGHGDSKFTLVGYSMGGGIAGVYAAAYPHKIEKLVLLAPAGIPFTLPFVGRITQVPYIGEFLMDLKWAKRTLMNRAEKSFIAPEKSPEQFEFVLELNKFHAYNKPGFTKAILSTLRNFPLNNLTQYYKDIGEKTNIPVLLIWGTLDDVTPYSSHKEMLELIPRAKFHSVEGGNHAMVLEDREFVYSHIVDFIRS